VSTTRSWPSNEAAPTHHDRFRARARGRRDIQLDAQQLETGWYRGNAPFNAILLASSINHFGTVATGTLYASQPSSSSGSGFGGGFSGGGGGGGGGGSW
jgi:hypothetical protein